MPQRKALPASDRTGRAPHRAATRIGAAVAVAAAPVVVACAIWAGSAVVADLAHRPLALSDVVVLAACAVAASIGAYLTVATLAITACAGSTRLRGLIAKVTPRAWRRLVSTALGVGLSAGIAAPGFAAVDEAPDQAGWLTQSTATASQETTTPRQWPHAPRPPEVAERDATASDSTTPAPQTQSEEQLDYDTLSPVEPSVITVDAGDNLWTLTAEALGDGATDSDIAQHWPQLYEHNKGLIGEEPDMIHPDMELDIPRGWTA